ncbi:MAG: kelch repeat-containing protein [Bryobacteraceae bacterium]
MKLTKWSPSLALPVLLAAISGTWVPVARMHSPRSGHRAALLQDGRVLVVGGWTTRGPLKSAELFSPPAGQWTVTGSMSLDRYATALVRLPDGRVLADGGCISGCLAATATAEWFDPAAGTWETTAGAMSSPRYYHSATLLQNGRVLVAGGCNASGCQTVTATAELFDPATGTFTPTGSLAVPRDYHTATLLPDGTVLVAGGFGYTGALNSAELYDPATGEWSTVGSMIDTRSYHAAAALPGGNVLVTGGVSANSELLATAEIYNRVTRAWSAAAPLRVARHNHISVLLGNGKVLVAGGIGDRNQSTVSLAEAELYDSASNSWSATGHLNTGRAEFTATVLGSGAVLAAGGLGNFTQLASAELFQ